MNQELVEIKKEGGSRTDIYTALKMLLDADESIPHKKLIEIENDVLSKHINAEKINLEEIRSMLNLSKIPTKFTLKESYEMDSVLRSRIRAEENNPTKKKEETAINKTVKFPYNKMEVKGFVKNVKLSEDKSRLNVTVLTDEKTPKYINVLVSGKERMDAFSKVNDQTKELKNEDGSEKRAATTVAISGIANFSEFEGNKNVTLLANQIEAGENSKIWNNKLSIVVNLGDDPKIFKNKGGEDFAVFSAAHNQVIREEQKTSWVEVIVPSSKMEEFKAQGIEKGTSVKIEGNVQPKSYENKDGKTLYSFQIVSNSIEKNIKLEQASAKEDLQQRAEQGTAKVNSGMSM